MPGGAWGERLLAEEVALVQGLREREQALAAEKRPDVDVDLHIGDVHWRGSLGDITSQGLLRVSLENRSYATDLLRLRFAHLLLCAQAAGQALRRRQGL